MLDTVRRTLRLLGYVAGRAAFIATMIVILTMAKTTDYGWTGPILIVAQIVLVGLVRWSWCAHDKWASEYVAWLNTGSVEAWTAWHRAYVDWSAQRASRARPRPRVTDAELDAELARANGRLIAVLDRHVDTEAGLQALLLADARTRAGQPARAIR